MTESSARSWSRKAPRGSRSTQPIAVLLGEGEDASALENFAAERRRTTRSGSTASRP